MKPAKVLHQAGDNRTLGWQGRVDLRAPQLILPISATNNPIVFGRVWLLARLDKSLHDFDCTDAETLVSGWADFAWLDLPGSQAAHEQPFRSVPLVQHLKYFVGFGGAHRFECFFLSTLAQQYLPALQRRDAPAQALSALVALVINSYRALEALFFGTGDYSCPMPCQIFGSRRFGPAG